VNAHDVRYSAATNGTASSDDSNVVRGRIEVQGTRAGVSGLIVRIFDVDTSTGNSLRRALGSTLTSDGVFELRYKDEIFRNDRRDGSRPNVLIAVMSPEGKGDGRASPLLFESEIRTAAAREECFLVHLSSEELTERHVVLPNVVLKTAGNAISVGAAAEIERERQKNVREQVVDVRRRAVADARKAEQKAESALRFSVLKQLTGLTPESPRWKHFVAPGEDAAARSRAVQKQELIATINPLASEVGARTYLVLSEGERADLGTPPDTAKLEQLLRRRSSTPTILREDPMALACLQRARDNPFHPDTTQPPTPDPGPESGTAADIDQKVGELVGGIADIPIFSNVPLPNPQSLANNITQLRLAKGPADVPALYDFHNLQIAFDHVWEDARAEGVIERAKELYRTVAEYGGNPQSALDGATDLLQALHREVDVIRKSRALYVESDGQPEGVMYRKPRNDDGSEPNEPPPDPPEPPEPGGPHPHPVGTHWPGEVYVPPQAEAYPFTLFAPNSINFGLLVTYRQTWKPKDHQVGRLVSTQTLAPKETISVSTRQVVKTAFNQKQIQANQTMRDEESSDTQRDEAEIVARAQTKTNFALTTAGSYDLGPLGEGTYTSSFGRESDINSQETKRTFRESVRKEAQKYRDERRMELETSTTEETETIQKRDFTNTNDELALTLVFYELQRCFQVFERLHRVIPVILVAQRVPRPEEITEAWILRHDWIVRRFLPDDSFRNALTYLATRAAGDRVILTELKSHMTSLRGVVEQLKVDVLALRREAERQYRSLNSYVERRAAIEENEHSEGMFASAWEWAAGADEESRDAIRILEEGARERYEKAAREEKDLRSRMEREMTALQTATDSYTRAYAEESNQRVQINRLIEHLKSNILHYMHGIWSYEHPDQQFFRHHTLVAPRLEALEREYTLTPVPDWPTGTIPEPGKQCFEATFTTVIDEDTEDSEKMATLAELSDLKPIGYKGNYYTAAEEGQGLCGKRLAGVGPAKRLGHGSVVVSDEREHLCLQVLLRGEVGPAQQLANQD
jgi:hypothetical protein